MKILARISSFFSFNKNNKLSGKKTKPAIGEKVRNKYRYPIFYWLGRLVSFSFFINLIVSSGAQAALW